MAITQPKMDRDHFYNSVDEEYLVAIGRVSAQWSILEGILDVAIWRAMGLRNDLGRILTAQLQMQSKLDTLSAVLTQKKPHLSTQFTKVCSFVRDCLIGKRNTVIHGMWHILPPMPDTPPRHIRGFVVKFSARGKLASQSGMMSTKELDQLALDIAEVTAWIYALLDHLPKLKLRPGGLIRSYPENQNRRDCATQKQQALQPLTPRPKAQRRQST